QAEDGIRDATVTGVQTCALPISDDLSTLLKPGIHQGSVCRVRKEGVSRNDKMRPRHENAERTVSESLEEILQRKLVVLSQNGKRSEERRVGKERKDRMDKYVVTT